MESQFCSSTSSKDCFSAFIRKCSLYKKSVPFLFLASHPKLASQLWNKKANIKQAAEIKYIQKFTAQSTVHETFIFIYFNECWYPRSLLVGYLRTIIWNILKSILFPGTVIVTTMWHPRAREIIMKHGEEKQNHLISSFRIFFYLHKNFKIVLKYTHTIKVNILTIFKCIVQRNIFKRDHLMSWVCQIYSHSTF